MNPHVNRMASPDVVWPWVVRMHRHANLLCGLFVLLGFTLWWLWSEDGKPGKAATVPEVSRTVWIGGNTDRTGGTWRPDSRAAASPLLFALPTPAGFSRGALSESGLPPPSVPAMPSIAPLIPAVPTVEVARVERTRLSELAVAARALPWPRAESGNDIPSSVDTSAVLVVVCLRDGAPARKIVVPAGTNAAWLDPQAWEAAARVGIDEHGWAGQVLLTRPTASTDRNAALVQLLRTTNYGTNGMQEARVTVRYDGRAEASQPAAEGAVP